MKMVYDEALQDYICDSETPIFGIEAVFPSPDYMMRLTFSNGENRLYNARPLLEKPIFYPLKNVNLFMQAHSDGVGVVWNDDLDIAPEFLYENSIVIDS